MHGNVGLTIVDFPREVIVRAFIKVSELTDEQAESLTRTLRAVEGVVDAEVFAEDRVASVLYDIRIGLPELVAAIQGAGYEAQPL